jgi:hypothetical protein
MLTGVAVMFQGPSHNFTGAWEFVAGVLVLIVLIFIGVYGRGDRSRRRTAHRTAHRAGRRAAGSASRGPGPGGRHGHRAVPSRRRPNRQ